MPFVIPQYEVALIVALATIALELTDLASTRWRFFHIGFLWSFASVALGGAMIAVGHPARRSGRLKPHLRPKGVSA